MQQPLTPPKMSRMVPLNNELHGALEQALGAAEGFPEDVAEALSGVDGELHINVDIGSGNILSFQEYLESYMEAKGDEVHRGAHQW